MFVEWLQKHGRDEAWLVADRVLTLALVVLGVVAILGAIFAPQIMRLYLSASDAPDKEAQIELGAFFLRWFMPQIVFYGIGAVATGLLQAERRFAAPMFAPILNNLAVIATFGVYALLVGGGTPSVESITFAEKTVLAAGTTFGVVAMTLALWPSLRSLGFRWHLRFDWNHPAVRRLGKLALWVVVYVVANQLAYVAIIVFTGTFAGRVRRSTRARSSSSSSRTRSSPCRSSPRSCRRCRAGGRTTTSTGCARCSRGASATRSSSSCRRRSGTSRSRSRS